MARSTVPHIFYHCWLEQGDPPPSQNLRTPAILSIATLRSVCQWPIHVLDLSDSPADWSHYPATLGFEVHRIRGFHFGEAARVPGWKHLSRIMDVQLWAERSGIEHVIYSDTDVFWLQAPLVPTQGFTFNRYNSGFYRYRVSAVAEFMSVFSAYTLAAVYSPEIRALLKSYSTYDAWYGVWDEMILRYMVERHPELVFCCAAGEHTTCADLPNLDPATVRMLHANSSMLHNPHSRPGGQSDSARGIYALAIREIFAKISEKLKPEHIEEIFTPGELRYFRRRQFSIFDAAKQFVSFQDPARPWHTDLNRFVVEPD